MSELVISEIDNKVIEKLGKMAGEFKQLEEQMNSPALAGNHVEITRLAREHGRIKSMVEYYYRYRKLAGQYEETLEMAGDNSDLEIAADGPGGAGGVK